MNAFFKSTAGGAMILRLLVNSFILLLIVSLASACVPVSSVRTDSPHGSIRTPQAAIAIVQRHLRRDGVDLSREEMTAEWRYGQWSVMSWYTRYPGNKGSSRFAPGGFTTYTVSPDGRITGTLPGA